jgi:hypothetical protein
VISQRLPTLVHKNDVEWHLYIAIYMKTSLMIDVLLSRCNRVLSHRHIKCIYNIKIKKKNTRNKTQNKTQNKQSICHLPTLDFIIKNNNADDDNDNDNISIFSLD